MKLIAALTLAAALLLSGCAVHRRHTYTDKMQTDLACKIVQEDSVDIRCHAVVTDTEKW